MKDLLQRLIAEGKVEVVSLADVFDKAPTHDEITSKSLEEFLHTLGESNYVFTNTGLDKDEIDRAEAALARIKRNKEANKLMENYLGEDFMSVINGVVDKINKDRANFPNEYLKAKSKEEKKEVILPAHLAQSLIYMRDELNGVLEGKDYSNTVYGQFFKNLIEKSDDAGGIGQNVREINSFLIKPKAEPSFTINKNIWTEAAVKNIQTKIISGLDTYYQLVYKHAKDMLSDVYIDEVIYINELTKIVKVKLKNKLWDFNYNGEFSDFIDTLSKIIDDKFTNAALSYNNIRFEFLETIRQYDQEELMKYYKAMKDAE